MVGQRTVPCPTENRPLSHARSFGPALVALFAGNAAPMACLRVFIVGPLAGAALAAWTYKALEK